MIATETDKTTVPVATEEFALNYGLGSLLWGLNWLAHTLIGFTVAMALGYALRDVSTEPLTPTRHHIILCVLGYQFLMAEAILGFSSSNGWSHPLKLKHKRLVHWVLQLVGSGMALAGSIIMIISRMPDNFGTIHGIAGLLAMIFTSISLVNGVASLYVFELRRCLRGNITKAGHICFGTAAFVCATVCLNLGFIKNGFQEWASPEFAYVLMGFAGLFTLIVIGSPLINLGYRLKDLTL